MKTRVLFVDDDTSLGNMVKQGLTILGHEVHYQSSMIALETVINEFRPNIIILDVEIGDKDGIDDSERIRELFPNIPIIFASSHTDNSFAIRAIEKGGINFLPKPLDIEVLNAYIKRFATKAYNSATAIGNFTFDRTTRKLTNVSTGDSNTLNKKEADIFIMLTSNVGKIVPREQIITEVWNNDFSSDQVLNNYISHLRKLLSSDPSIIIESIPREGYKVIIND